MSRVARPGLPMGSARPFPVVSRRVLAAWVALAVSLGAPLASAESRLEQAADDLKAGRNVEAREGYEALLHEHGDNPDLYYNLGLACARHGDLPSALLAFERSLALEPRANDASEHLELARAELQRSLLSAATDRSLTQGEPTQLVWWRFFHGLGTFWPALVLLATWSTAFLALLVRRLVKHAALRDTLAVSSAVSIIVAATAAVVLGGQHYTRDVRPGIVIAPEPRLAESPTELASTAESADLYAGATVLILGEQDAWLQVELADGERGWLGRDDVGEVRRDAQGR